MGMTRFKSHDNVKGKLLEVEVEKKVVKVTFTWHALDPMQGIHATTEINLFEALFGASVIDEKIGEKMRDKLVKASKSTK